VGANGQINVKFVRDVAPHSLESSLPFLDAAANDDHGGRSCNGAAPNANAVRYATPNQPHPTISRWLTPSPKTFVGLSDVEGGLSVQLKSRRLNPIDSGRRYGDFDVKLDVINVNRKLLRKKYTNYITNFKKDTSSLQGG
jgi:hypothetical protein